MHLVPDGDLGQVPRQPHFAVGELGGDDSQRGDTRLLGQELRDDVAAIAWSRSIVRSRLFIHVVAPPGVAERGV